MVELDLHGLPGGLNEPGLDGLVGRESPHGGNNQDGQEAFRPPVVARDEEQVYGMRWF